MRVWIALFLGLLLLVPAVARAQSPAAHPLGVNLESVSDWARSKVFADAMKSARAFGSVRAPWDGTAQTDANGWPTSDFGVIVIADVPHIAGTYKVVFTGQARVAPISPMVKVLNPAYDAATNTTRADVFVSRDATNLFLAFQQTQPTPTAAPGGGVTGIHLWRPDLKTDQTFTPPFLKALEPFSVLRFMDFTATNNPAPAQWQDRPHVTDALQSGPTGVAWEYAIELANTAGKDLWINVPDQADADYIRQLAKLFKEKLAPGRIVYVEYSNELFNGFTKQYARNIAAAKAEIAAGKWTLSAPPPAGTEDHLLGQLRLAKVTVEISQTFRDVYGFAANDKAFFQHVRPVLCVQTANPEKLAAALEFIDKNFTPPGGGDKTGVGGPATGPAGHLYAVGVGIYPNLWNAPHRELTTADVLTTLEASIKEIKAQYPPIKLLAEKYHLHLLAYEGGTDVQGDQSQPAKRAAQINPRMETLITQLLTDWYAAGGELFCYYNLCGVWGNSGMWGLSEEIDRDTPKWTAIRKMAGTTK